MQKTNKKPSTTTASLSLAALGVVYGDIGTSPLYALRETLSGLAINTVDVLGVLSLILWSLILLVCIKYLCFLIRADNDGEGGILALLALLRHKKSNQSKFLFLIGILGSGLVLGDGMITPAISILSAVEGIHVLTPALSHWVMPLTCLILVVLFGVQSFGTAKIGVVFGPILLLWFATLALLGISHIIHNPVVLYAINPKYAFMFFQEHGFLGYTLLGGIFLVVTGGEVLYADLGHFGKKAIRVSWFSVVFPALVFNYFGQGAYLLTHPEAIENPFFLLAPPALLLPLIILATAATIIASQAVISASFSLIRQAILLGLYPKLNIIQTSDTIKGQIYIPQMNWFLATGTLLLVLAFHNASALTHAYGLAVNLVMVFTSTLFITLIMTRWQWPWYKVLGICLFVAFTDLSFLGANLQKIKTGGWAPVLFAAIAAFTMYTWYTGRLFLRKELKTSQEDIPKLLKQLNYTCINKLPQTTAILITDIYDEMGSNFLRFMKMNLLLPENILILNYDVLNIPHVYSDDRYQLKTLQKGIYTLTLRYGFMDTISIPQALHIASTKKLLPFDIHVDSASYFIELSNVFASRRKKTMWFLWQEKLFAFLERNYSANLNIEFYQLPYDRTIAIGAYYMV